MVLAALVFVNSCGGRGSELKIQDGEGGVSKWGPVEMGPEVHRTFHRGNYHSLASERTPASGHGLRSVDSLRVGILMLTCFPVASRLRVRLTL